MIPLLCVTKAAGAQALGPSSWDWQERAHKLVWKLKRVQGGTDVTLKVKPIAIAHRMIHVAAVRKLRNSSLHLCRQGLAL